MSQAAWYDDDESPEQVTADLEQLRRNMTADERRELAAYLLEGQEPAKREPVPADAATEEHQGQGDGQASGPRAPVGAESTRIVAEFRSGKRIAGSPEDMEAFFTARLNESAG
jgi:hypothetical protein